MLRTPARLNGTLDCMSTGRANLSTAFLTGAAIVVPIYISPLLASQWLLIRSVVAMVCLGYVALLAIFVHGPAVWKGWRFVSEDGESAPIPRVAAWLIGAGVACALLGAAGQQPFHHFVQGAP